MSGGVLTHYANPLNSIPVKKTGKWLCIATSLVLILEESTVTPELFVMEQFIHLEDIYAREGKAELVQKYMNFVLNP